MAKNIPEVEMTKVNLIGESTRIEGDLATEDDLRIDGIVNGNINSNSRIIIGPTATINGNIKAQNIEVNGKVTGNIEAYDILILKESSELTGDINVFKLSIQAGALFNGKCTMKVKSE
ncbi:MAG: polymer-forming cytoskeletal protein [Bacteroidales bacterium]|jgi:cytoskeletal protein CcmA (bactofilin family)|nr:polymer-forming cytoskeletal protein [Bacteroidales bacterium]MDI9575827.1 polymer-forming cytoskeletal protein [Bacteroidota bacterium]MDD2593137.1 polymer-forming cytoskeletal protein [Bacteroidales bacterium]MDD3755852.1 polymer-forming cytoskeletal protein [Bacteroidales bacterium]MDY0400772.1 polymer-forming cytoskeletal protein [Bacteroidales bacterium]